MGSYKSSSPLRFWSSVLYVSGRPFSKMSCIRIFALAIRCAPKQLCLSPTYSHAAPIHCFPTNSFDSGASHVRISYRSRWVHTSRHPDETTKKTEEKNEGGEAERKKTEEEKKQGNVKVLVQSLKRRQELRKLIALESEMEGLEKVEIEVAEKLGKEIMYFDKLGGRECVWKIQGLKGRQEVEKEFQEKLKRERENWERLQKEYTESLERLKAYDVLENEREEVRRKVGMKQDERDKAVKLLISSYQDVLSSPATP